VSDPYCFCRKSYSVGFPDGFSYAAEYPAKSKPKALPLISEYLRVSSRAVPKSIFGIKHRVKP